MIIARPESAGAGCAGTDGLTVNVTTAGAALVPWSVCKAPPTSVLRKLPARNAITSTVIVHMPATPPTLPGIDRVMGKVTVVPPAIAATAPVPLHVVPAFGTGAITNPVGNVSVSGAVKVAALMFGLDSVIVRVETAPTPASMVAGLKALPSVGGPPGGTSGTTVNVALAAAPLMPLLVFKCAGDQRVDIGTRGRRGHVHRHRAGARRGTAAGRDRPGRGQGHR